MPYPGRPGYEESRHRSDGGPPGYPQPYEPPPFEPQPYEPQPYEPQSYGPQPFDQPGYPADGPPSDAHRFAESVSIGYPSEPRYPESRYRAVEQAEQAASGSESLPQRVPAEPDVPTVPEPAAVEPSAETPELARIATHLRREDDAPRMTERPDGFDVQAILGAVRGVVGVRDASLRTTPAGAHSLRLELSDGADPAEVSRLVARLLQDRMGLAAAPQDLPVPPTPEPTPAPAPAPAPVAAPESAWQSGSESFRHPEPESAWQSGSESFRHPEPESAWQSGSESAWQSAAQRDRAEADPARSPENPPAQPVREVPESPVRPDPVTTGPVSGEDAAGVATANTSYSGGQATTTETALSRPLRPGGTPGPRVVIGHVQVSTFGLEATVEVRLAAGDQPAAGMASGPAVDGYVLRLCAVAAAAAIDELLRVADPTPGRGRCFVEHAAVVPFGVCKVATVVVLLVCDGWVEQLAGSALVSGDPRQAIVRATLAAVNRRLEALLSET